MSRPRKPVTLPAEPTSDTISAVNTPFESLLKPELVKLLYKQNDHIDMLVKTLEFKDEQLRLKDAEDNKHTDEINNLSKTAETVIRSMHAYQENRIQAIFQIMNSVQVLFKDPDYKEAE